MINLSMPGTSETLSAVVVMGELYQGWEIFGEEDEEVDDEN